MVFITGPLSGPRALIPYPALSRTKLRYSMGYNDPVCPLFALAATCLRSVTIKLTFEIHDFDLILTPFWPHFDIGNSITHFDELSPLNSKMDRSRRISNRFWISRALRVALVACFRMAHSTAPLPRFFARVAEHLSKSS